MEPEIKLAQGEVVQMEGWMLKRKTISENDGDESVYSDLTDSIFPTQIAPSGSKLEALLLRKMERKRYLVLTTQRGDDRTPPKAVLTYCSKKPAFVREESSSANFGLMAKKAFQFEVNSQFVRGQIELSDTIEISLLDTSELAIVVPGKTYYFRPLQKGRNLAESKIEAGQWYAAIRRAIKDVWDMQRNRNSREKAHNSSDTRLEECPDTLRGVLDSEQHRKNFKLFCEISHAAENMEFYDKVEEYESKYATIQGSTAKRGSGIAKTLSRLSVRAKPTVKVPKDLILLGKEIAETYVREGAPKQVNLSDLNRSMILESIAKSGDKAFTSETFSKAKNEIFQLMETNFFMRFYREEMRKTGCFSQLFARSGMRGYEAVIGHFGKVKTDMDRLISLYELRLSQVDAQMKVLREALHISHDVALPSFRTMRDATLQLFRTNAVYIQALSEFRTQLTEHVNFPLQWMKRSIEIQLESIINGVAGKSKALEDSKKDLDDTRRKLKKLKYFKDLTNMDDYPNEEAMDILRVYDVEEDEVDGAIAKSEELIPQLEMISTRLVKEFDDCVIDSLDKLETLEQHRIESQQRTIRHAIEAEKAFFQALHKEAVSTTAVSQRIDPPSDVENFIKVFTDRLQTKAAEVE